MAALNRMISKPKSKPIEELNTYRCPACGEMVHKADRDAVRLHHDHVLHPRHDISISLPQTGRIARNGFFFSQE
jgi:hypothetical protein